MTDEPIVPSELVTEVEEVDGLPVIAEVRPVEVASAGTLGAVQTAAAAATGFLAGAATLVLMQRLASRRLARQPMGVRRGYEFMPVVSSRTYIVDVHTIAKPGE
jgi:hypothetical protein